MILRYIFGDSLGPRRHQTVSRSPRQKTFLTLFILILIGASVYFSLPNLYFKNYYVIQVIPKDLSRTEVSIGAFRDFRAKMREGNLSFVSINRLITDEYEMTEVVLDNQEDMLNFRPVTEEFFKDEYEFSYGRKRVLPGWLSGLGNRPVSLGLDLNGGVHFLMEVDILAAIRQRIDLYASQMRNLLRRERLRMVSLTTDKQHIIENQAYPMIEVGFAIEGQADEAKELLTETFEGMEIEERQEGGVFYLNLFFSEDFISQIEDFAIDQNMATLRERINELGVSEPIVQRQGGKRIVVQIPGIQDPVAAKRIIGSTANLEFRLESLAQANAQPFRFRANSQESAYLERNVIVTGSHVINAQVQYDQDNLPQVAITLDGEGGRLMNRATRTNIGRSMAVLLVESIARNVTVSGRGETSFSTRTTKEIISLATIRDALGSRFVITGLGGRQEASSLALLLRAGALAAPIYFVEERTIGPSLGQDNIRRGLISLIAGLLIVMLFILFYYKLAGVFANIALIMNLTLILMIMSQLSAVLTLPGIAGMVLTVGMAIDANILIFSRIKEEMKQGLQFMAAINAGYDRAFITILDANITTLLVAIILFALGTGPIKGFAITLSIGILCSLFTSIVVTRRMMEWVYESRRLSKISI